MKIMKCFKCNSDKIASIGAKCSDLCSFSFDGLEKDGYVPTDVGIGGGDYVEFDYCLNCGQIQGKFPIDSPYMGNGYCPECGDNIADKYDNQFECSCGWIGNESELITKNAANNIKNDLSSDDVDFLNKEIELGTDPDFWN